MDCDGRITVYVTGSTLYYTDIHPVDVHSLVKKVNKVVISILLLLALVSGCDNETVSEPAELTVRKTVEITRIEPETVVDRYEYSGVLEAYHDARLSNEVAGVITDYSVDKGSRIKKGQVLVMIDDDDYQRVVEEMEARYERAVAVRNNAEKDYVRKKSLFDRSVVSESNHDVDLLALQTAKADERLAKVRLEQSRDDYGKTKIYSPFDGVVLEKYQEVGELVPVGTVLVHVADYSKVTLEMGLSEKDIVHVQPDSAVEVYIDPFPQERFAGMINYIGVNSESETGTFPVEIIIDNQDLMLLPGMVGRSSVAGQSHPNLILIPQSALRKYFGEAFVFVEEDGRAMRRPVLLGAAYGERIEITSGLAAGEHLITVGTSNLFDGDSVKAHH